MRMNPFTYLGRWFAREPDQTGDVYQERLSLYQMEEGYYDNTVYRRVAQNGVRDWINESLGRPVDADLAGLYNPVSEVVDLYLHALGGDFGTDIKILSDNDLLTADATLGNRTIPSPITRIWRWSVMDQKRQEICRLAAKHGNCGLRIVSNNHPDVSRRRVYIKPEHPRIIRDAELDARGNVQQILFEYDEITGIGDAQTVVTIRELQTPERFTRWYVKHGQREQEPFEDYRNELGVVSYVLLPHELTGDVWGRSAFYRALDQINRLNVLGTHINKQIERHVRVMWLIAAAGKAPVSVDLSGETIAYVDTTGSTTPPHMEAMVANLNLADAISQSQQLLGQIEDKLPELKATGGRFLSGQSGETVKELRKPAEDRLALARANYEDALVRAQQIALSWGVLYSMWDIGTGTGTREAADRAYHEGYEDHVFNKRPLLPEDTLDRQTREYTVAGLMKTAGLPTPIIMEELGKGADWIEKLEQAQQQQQEQAMTIAQATGGRDDSTTV